MKLHLRQSSRNDLPAIEALARAAFGDADGPEIGALIGALLADPTARPLVSLVAVSDDRVVGHVLFTAVQLDGGDDTLTASILAPLAVQPDYQNRGIGGRLIQAGLEQLKQLDVALVFVLGHPGYYPRYGFSPAGIAGFEAPYPIAPENADAWMVQALRPGILGRVSGRVRCARALDEERYWVE